MNRGEGSVGTGPGPNIVMKTPSSRSTETSKCFDGLCFRSGCGRNLENGTIEVTTKNPARRDAVNYEQHFVGLLSNFKLYMCVVVRTATVPHHILD